MRRYFDIPKERLVLSIGVNEKGMELTIEQIEKATNNTGLIEIDVKEYDRLEKLYSKI